MSVEPEDALFQSAENGGRVDDIGARLKDIGVETVASRFQSADVGARLKACASVSCGGKLAPLEERVAPADAG